MIQLSWLAPGVLSLAAEIEDRIHPGPEDARPITPAQIEGWLRIEPGQSRFMHGDRWRLYPLNSICINGLLCLVPWLWLWREYGAVVVTVAIALLLRRATAAQPPVTATVHALRYGRLLVPWNEVWSVNADWPGYKVMTARGTVRLPQHPDSDPIIETITQLQNARRAGQTLPRIAEIPDAAISRAETVEVSAERGLSRPEEQS